VDGQPMCRMYYLPADQLPRPGDLVVTSGIGMSFPKGIPIGKVRESTRGMENNKQYIVVEPQVDFEHIEYVIVLRYQPTAEAVEDRTSSTDGLTLVPLETSQPVPTIKIGSEFYQLAPTPEPTPEPSPSVPLGENGGLSTITPRPTQPSGGGNLEYQVPAGRQTDNSYGFTLAPTATPSPTPPPLDLSVEEDVAGA
ncbi:MAG: rod shape-determining protein MreC, partial [Clostridia bacterium]